MPRSWNSLPLFLSALSCGFPQPASLTDGGHIDGSSTDGSGGNIGLRLELIAGDINGPGFIDGDAGVARFGGGGCGLTADDSGNIYVGDQGNFSLRRIAPTGQVTTLAGRRVFSEADGPGIDARFEGVQSLAYGGSALYVVDSNAESVRLVSLDGTTTTFDGPGSGATYNVPLSFPRAITFDAGNGTLYISDGFGHAIKRSIAGGQVKDFVGGSAGSADGSGSAAKFELVSALSVDSLGFVYAAESSRNRIRKISPTGSVVTIAGQSNVAGHADGPGSIATFNSPRGLATDGSGNVYVADSGNATVRKITPQGVVSTFAGFAGSVGDRDGAGSSARFRDVCGISFDRTSNVLFVFDSSRVRRISLDGTVTSFVGQVGLTGTVDGDGPEARFGRLAGGFGADSVGNIYLADLDHATIRQITSSGTVTTLAGSPDNTGFADGRGSQARFVSPSWVAVGANGNLYVTDASEPAIRQISSLGDVTTLAGSNGSFGNVDGVGAAASFETPFSLAIGSDGTLAVVDLSMTLRQVTPHGKVSTLAGHPDSGGDVDGLGSAAFFDSPDGVVVAADGTIYVSDGNDYTIRKVDETGLVSTLAGGSYLPGFNDGPGSSAALFNLPSGLAVDSDGNIFVADTFNSAIRRITPAGLVTTVAGSPSRAEIALGPQPGFYSPAAVAVVGDDLIVIDSFAILRLRHGVR